MQPYQERVIQEKQELDEKLSRLKLFLMGSMFQSLPGDEQGRLERQAELMSQYSAVLGERIANFPK